MIVVVGLAAILLVMTITSAQKQRTIARDKVRVADIQLIRLALEEYKTACGEYPAKLQAGIGGDTCPNGINLDSFLPYIPQVPPYTDNFKYPSQGQDYFYYGLSSATNGRCYDYIVGVQLEFGADSNFVDESDAAFFAEVNQSSLAPSLTHPYRYQCFGSLGNGIPNADDPAYGIYGFRSTNAV